MKIMMLAVLLLLTGCARQPEWNGIDTVLKDVAVSGRQTARSVVYGSPDNEDCRAIAERAGEILKAPDSESPINGLLSRDVQGPFSPYRAYFLPSQLIDVNQAAFAFCSGEKTALVPARCRLLGVTSRGCFQTGLYGIADADGIESTVDAIHKNWPKNFDKDQPD